MDSRHILIIGTVLSALVVSTIVFDQHSVELTSCIVNRFMFDELGRGCGNRVQNALGFNIEKVKNIESQPQWVKVSMASAAGSTVTNAPKLLAGILMERAKDEAVEVTNIEKDTHEAALEKRMNEARSKRRTKYERLLKSSIYDQEDPNELLTIQNRAAAVSNAKSMGANPLDLQIAKSLEPVHDHTDDPNQRTQQMNRDAQSIELPSPLDEFTGSPVSGTRVNRTSAQAQILDSAAPGLDQMIGGGAAIVTPALGGPVTAPSDRNADSSYEFNDIFSNPANSASNSTSGVSIYDDGSDLSPEPEPEL